MPHSPARSFDYNLRIVADFYRLRRQKPFRFYPCYPRLKKFFGIAAYGG